MDEEMLSAEEFFGDVGHRDRSPRVRVSDHKTSPKGQESFQDIKIRMVMKIENCSREEAIRIIAVRAEELRSKEKDEVETRPY